MPDNRKRWWSDIPVGPRWVVLVFAALVILGCSKLAGISRARYGGAELASTRITTNSSWRYAQRRASSKWWAGSMGAACRCALGHCAAYIMIKTKRTEPITVRMTGHRSIEDERFLLFHS
jgi:hypothetical protein